MLSLLSIGAFCGEMREHEKSSPSCQGVIGLCCYDDHHSVLLLFSPPIPRPLTYSTQSPNGRPQAIISRGELTQLRIVLLFLGGADKLPLSTGRNRTELWIIKAERFCLQFIKISHNC
ncbi:hypothetical protein CDAR_314031 [Caerostris darwini]|uniref:Uncharacterized protein n=1 Tax=Caerostris darwini TaxID=1538125 RepID=A0AAV4MXM9_9ARAC|nr:hypothetical protein CDAR_314031 [Caerostris darwini]